MAALLALLAATAFAFGNVLQQKETLEAPASGDDPRSLAQILKRPVWLAGGTLQVSGRVLQAGALDRGSLVVVQSLCAMSLDLRRGSPHTPSRPVTRRASVCPALSTGSGYAGGRRRLVPPA